MKWHDLVRRIAATEQAGAASMISLVEYDDGAVRPVGVVLFDLLVDDREMSDMIGRAVVECIKRGRKQARAPGGGSVL